MRRLALVFLGWALAGIPHVPAGNPTLIMPYHPPSHEEAEVAFTKLLKPVPEDPMHFALIVRDAPGPGTHLRIRYRSDNPVPIEFGPLRTHPSDLLTAVLPPADDGVALLPLTSSPSWHPWSRGVLLKVYERERLPVGIGEIAVLNRATFIETLASFLRHPFFPERFTFSSMSELAGYRIGGVSVSVVLGGLLIVCCVWLICKRGRSAWKVLPCIMLAFLLLYEVRFLVDITRSTARHQKEWRSERTYGHMGYTYAVADALRGELAGDAETHVLSCGRMTTPLRYLLFPVPVSSPGQLRGGATHAVVRGVWDETVDTVRCDAYAFSGSVIATFPDGTAVAVPPGAS